MLLPKTQISRTASLKAIALGVRQPSRLLASAAFVAAALAPDYACAATGPELGGGKLGLLWTLPFVGILASIAILPSFFPRFWHRGYGLVALFWALAFLAPFAAAFGFGAASQELLHVLILEFIPFVALIGALFVIAGGIYIGGDFRASPKINSLIMLTGMVLASFAGTTGAAMILIRPIIRANADRKYKTHIAVFFIFLVCNIGGALTPLGDPPLFLGFLQGVDFFWPLKHLWPHTLLLAAIELAAFYAVDAYLFAKEGVSRSPANAGGVSVQGLINAPLLVLVVAAVVASGWNLGGKLSILGVEVAWMSAVRDLVLIGAAAASLLLTPRACRQKNEFDWEPLAEVAKLFAAIFITIAPVVAILKAGPEGAFGPLFGLLGSPAVPNNTAYFWLTGLLSSFLDNAPTYLVFFNAAGGDSGALMGPMSSTLAAISAGAVFMGANTYIGNAPNFMVRSIALSLGVKMPGFFGFVLWSTALLFPAYALISLLFFN
jgi:Na+/H+ antiporter NhaD/arsenite permease-like protein